MIANAKPSQPSAVANSEVAPPAPARPLWKSMLVFLIPMMASNMLQALSGTVNNMYLGQMLGVGALAAVSAFFPLLFLLISFTIGIGSGATVLVGQAYGANEIGRMKAVAGTTLSVAALLGLLIAVFGGTFTNSVLAMTGTPANIMPEAVAYARVFLFALPLVFIYLIATTILRGVGDTVTPLLTLALATIISLVLTPAFIRGWLGLPQMGVASGAWASIASFFVALVWLSLYLLKRGHPLAPDRILIRHLWIDWQILKKVLSIGIPTGIQVVLVSLAGIAVLSFVNEFGSSATAAYGAINQMASYVQFPAISIAIAGSIFGAQAIGRGQADRLGQITKTALILNAVITGVLIAFTYLFSRTIIGWFIVDNDVADLAERLVRITLWSYLLYGAAAVISGIMRSSGTVLWPTVISIFAICGIEVPVAYLLKGRLGIDGVWISYPIAFTAMLGMQTAYYQLVWRKKSVARLI